MIHYIHSEFNAAFTRHLTLFLEIDVHDFTFCIFNHTDGNISVIKKVNFNQHRQETFQFEKFQSAINTEDLLHCPFSSHFVSAAFETFTLVPESLFQKNLSEKYLDLITVPDIASASHSELIAPLKAILVYHLQHKLTYFIEKLFKNVQIHHLCSALLKRASAYAENNNGIILFTEIRTGYFYSILFSQGSLLFLNKFNYTNKEDFLYYILLLCDQNKIDRANDTLLLSGDILEGSVLYNELYKFFMHINFMPKDDFFNLPEALPLPAHTINGLLSLHQCALYQET